MLIFTEVTHRALAALTGALLTVIFGLLYRVFKYEEVLSFVDIKVLSFILGLFIMVEILNRVGVFKFMGLYLINYAKTPRMLMIVFTFLTVLLSMVIENIPAMLIVGSLIMVVSKEKNIDPIPYIIASAIATSIGGIMLLISSIPSLLVGLAFGVGFYEFLKVSVPFALLLTLITLIIFIFWITPKYQTHQKIDIKYDPWSAVKDRKLLKISILILIVTLFLLAFYDKLMIGLEFIVIGSSITLLLITRENLDDILKSLDWPTLLFLMGFFIVIGGLSKAGVIEVVSKKILSISGGKELFLAVLTLWMCGLASGFVDNVPITTALIPVIQFIAQTTHFNIYPLIWSLVFGANLGGSLTPIGSPSIIVALGILEKEGYRGFFRKFFKIGATIAVLHLFLATTYILLMFYLSKLTFAF